MDKKVFPLLIVDNLLAVCIEGDSATKLLVGAVKDSSNEYHLLRIAPRGEWHQLVALCQDILLANPAEAEYDEDEPALKALFDARQEILDGWGDLKFSSQWLPSSHSPRSKAQNARFSALQEELSAYFPPSGLNRASDAKAGATDTFPFTSISYRIEGQKVVLGNNGAVGNAVPVAARDLVFMACAVLADAETRNTVPEAWAPFLAVAFERKQEQQHAPTAESPVTAPVPPMEISQEARGIPLAYVVVD